MGARWPQRNEFLLLGQKYTAAWTVCSETSLVCNRCTLHDPYADMSLCWLTFACRPAGRSAEQPRRTNPAGSKAPS